MDAMDAMATTHLGLPKSYIPYIPSPILAQRAGREMHMCDVPVDPIVEGWLFSADWERPPSVLSKTPDQV